MPFAPFGYAMAVGMEVKVAIHYGDGLAHYVLTPEERGIYQARLLRWEGGRIAPPPREITLVRGLRHWVGSCDRPALLEALGRALEPRTRGRDPNSPP